MFFFKGCPKCRGDVVLDNDVYGGYLRCLQCGFIKDLIGSYDMATGTLELGEELKVA